MLYMYQSRSNHGKHGIAWHKASEQDVNLYKDRLDDLLSNIKVDDEMLHCGAINCTHHNDMIGELYDSVMSSCITASDHIPITTRGSKKFKIVGMIVSRN